MSVADGNTERINALSPVWCLKKAGLKFLVRDHLTHNFDSSMQLMRRLVPPVWNVPRKKCNGQEAGAKRQGSHSSMRIACLPGTARYLTAERQIPFDCLSKR